MASADRTAVLFADVSDSTRLHELTGDEIAAKAINMQNSVTPLEPVAVNKLDIPVGFNFGPALARSGDIFGDTVNVAARPGLGQSPAEMDE